MDTGDEGICEEYASSLEDLTFNSKPLINVLTMLAEENSQYAENITKLIEKRICQVCSYTFISSTSFLMKQKLSGYRKQYFCALKHGKAIDVFTLMVFLFLAEYDRILCFRL